MGFYKSSLSDLTMGVVEMLQSQFQVAAEKLQTTQKEYSKVMSDRQTLDSQLSENKQVKEELDLAPEDGKIFKLIGPALVPQELGEARSNVEKRINYIAGELKRKEDLMAELDKAGRGQREDAGGAGADAEAAAGTCLDIFQTSEVLNELMLSSFLRSRL